MQIRPFLTAAYLTLASTLFAADPAKVQAIADYLKNQGTLRNTTISGETVSGKEKEFIIRGGPGNTSRPIRVLPQWIVFGGVEALVINHELGKSPEGIKRTLIVLEEYHGKGTGYDGKPDNIYITMELPDGNKISIEIPENTEDFKIAETAHDISIDQIYDQLPQEFKKMVK